MIPLGDPYPSPVGVLELRPTAVVAGGDALARDDDGRVVLVSGALPGELVLAETVSERRDLARARTTAVLEAAPERMTPPCPHLLRGCGGCTWQHVDPLAQPRLKASIVADALKRIARLPEPNVVAAPPLPSTGYRSTVRMAVTRDGRLAYRKGASHELVDVDTCLVAAPPLQELMAEGRFRGAAEVTLRCGLRTGQRLAIVTPTAIDVHLPDDVLVVGADELRVGRRAWFHEEVDGRRLRVSARSFFQPRPDGAEALVEAVAEALTGAPDGPLVDAYGGVGLFAATVGVGRPVTVVERSASAVADARVNLGQGTKVLRLDVDRWRPSPAAAVVADPSRHGLGRSAVRALAGTGAERLVLVSCDAAALARDAQLLAAAGYRLTATTVVDLFPHTPHVEAVSSFDLIRA